MKGLREKFRKHEGFTLVEMLIVVAIIAILVAVSIPMVGTSLNKAKKATDDANLRSAKAAAVIEIVGNQEKNLKDKWYDNVSGTFVPNPPTAYSQETEGQAVKVTDDDPENITVAWAAVS